MSTPNSFLKDVFTSLKELLGMERHAQFFSMIARKQKVKSILGGRHESKLRGRGLDFEEVRHYVKGDDIRNIDWKVTARTRETHTRVFSEEKEKPALIVVDQSKSMFFGSQVRTKSVVAAELAAVTAFRVLKQGDRVGGVVFADNGIDIIQPKRDRRNILRFLEKVVSRNRELAESTPRNIDDALKEVFMKTRNIVTHDYLVVVISDFQRYSPAVTRFISQIAQHNDVVLIKVFDPLERDIPQTKFVAGDQETQVTVDGKSKKIRENFQTGFDADYQAFLVQMKKHRIPLFAINTVQPIEEQLKEVFKSGRK
ncbi:DUF58 domain-containing protein [Algoriphagus halophytocola]|uniref:DUF58 domain-containing protein n=1 Tax=Algoriphagus halophytocola TaxID=2991499 RepID=A0ABY6MDI3_9BACT|nr:MULTISPECIES: DUF58 domain-containing protein [unclassified Algoriphagus]UZD21837.1 DUF58 domain-containing protein [Algoriphagus sp. TR-M5]WBL43051.1 DUF58 domain-containing protein [Algoriphagus sp. TR-M9]